MKKWIVSLLVVSGLFVTSYDIEAAQTSGWNFVSNQWRYTDTNGSYYKGWHCIRNQWYYFDSSSVMKTGWQKVNGVWYYLSSSGAMQTGWQKVNGAWYYLSSSGAMQTGWQKVNGAWYYLSSSGAMQTGWQKVNGAWYYLSSSGAMQTGWQKVNGTWYYLSSNGAMKTGWFDYAGKKYYLKSSGAMATNTTIGEYKIDAYGVATKQESPEKKLAKEYFALVNQERKRVGVQELIWSDEVYVAAMIRAKEMNQYFEHVRPDGRDFDTVADDIGLKKLYLISEAATRGTKTPLLIFESQKNSSDHYKLMISPYAKYGGVGITGIVMTMLYAID